MIIPRFPNSLSNSPRSPVFAGASLNSAPKTSAAQAAQANRAQRRQGAGAAGYVPGGPHVWLDVRTLQKLWVFGWGIICYNLPSG